jgi:hypothetical protein
VETKPKGKPEQKIENKTASPKNEASKPVEQKKTSPALVAAAQE